jgi:hypothetical protein
VPLDGTTERTHNMTALAQPADPTWAEATINLRTARQEQIQTVVVLGAMLARLLTDNEIDAIHDAPDSAANIMLNAAIETRIKVHRGGWATVSMWQLEAANWAAILSLDGLPMDDFDRLHASGEVSRRKWFPPATV